MQTAVSSFTPPPVPVAPSAVAALAEVHALSVDAREGLAGACPRSLQTVQARLAGMHARHAASVGALLVAEGQASRRRVAPPVLSMAALLDGADADAWTRLRQGERQVIAAFDAALACDLPCTTLARLRAMRAELSDLLVEMRHLG